MTAWRIELHPGAGEDYLEALDWYLQRRVLVAQRFQKELAYTLERIAAQPELSAADDERIRWTKMHRFPHGIFKSREGCGSCSSAGSGSRSPASGILAKPN